MTETRILNAQPWREGLFGCCSDLSTCCYGCVCTPCLFGETMGKTLKETSGCSGCCGYCLTMGGCCCFVHKPARERFREAYGLEAGSGLASDMCASWCCSACGVCQEAREAKARGDPPMITTVGHAGVPPSTIGRQPVQTVPASGALTSQPL